MKEEDGGSEIPEVPNPSLGLCDVLNLSVWPFHSGVGLPREKSSWVTASGH